KKIDQECDNGCCSTKKISSCDCGSLVYFVGFIGAIVYFITTATGFWVGVLGVLKAIVWPAFLVYGVLQFLGV
ncbi:MAG: hypothetical protein ACMXYC_03690, partial [Candidatus Woesearchaeota archaeon]